MCGVWMDGWKGQNKEQSERAGWCMSGGRTMSQPICSSSLIPKRKREGRVEEVDWGGGGAHHASHFISQYCCNSLCCYDDASRWSHSCYLLSAVPLKSQLLKIESRQAAHPLWPSACSINRTIMTPTSLSPHSATWATNILISTVLTE